MYPKIHEGEVSEVEPWFSELPLICFHCNQHKRFLWSRQRQHSHANTLKDGDSPSWAVYLDTLDKRYSEAVMGFRIFIGISADKRNRCMLGSGFGGDWVWQPRHTASKERTRATLESKLNAKRCNECEAVCVLKDLDTIIPLLCFLIFSSSSEGGSKRRRGGEGRLDD